MLINKVPLNIVKIFGRCHLSAKSIIWPFSQKIMHTKLHITCVLTGTFKYFPYYWTTWFLGKTAENIKTQAHYIFFRKFSLLQNDKHGVFAFCLFCLNYCNYFLNCRWFSKVNRNINTNRVDSVYESIQNTTSVTPARYIRTVMNEKANVRRTEYGGAF